MTDWPTAVPVDEAHLLRQMHPAQGAVWLRTKHPDLADADLQAAVGMACQGEAPEGLIVLAQPQLRHEFSAAAYLLGASVTQLSTIFQMSRSAVHQAITRRLSKDVREAERPYRLQFETVQVLWNEFQKHVRGNPTVFDGFTIQQLSEFLRASVDLKEEW